LKDVLAFLGFANVYHHLIHNYSCIVQPLTFLTWKGIPFTWEEEQQIAFDMLKNTFMSAPNLTCFIPDCDVIVEPDASDYVSTSVSS
jgi:hypothetical protein